MSSVFRYSILTTYSPYIVYVFREYSCLNSLFHTYSDDGFGVRFYSSEADNISVFEGFGRQSVPTQRSLVADAVACVVTATTDGPPPIDDDERTAGAAHHLQHVGDRHVDVPLLLAVVELGALDDDEVGGEVDAPR